MFIAVQFCWSPFLTDLKNIFVYLILVAVAKFPELEISFETMTTLKYIFDVFVPLRRVELTKSDIMFIFWNRIFDVTQQAREVNISANHYKVIICFKNTMSLKVLAIYLNLKVFILLNENTVIIKINKRYPMFMDGFIDLRKHIISCNAKKHV